MIERLPQFICHDVLQCSDFSQLQKNLGINSSQKAMDSFIKNMDGMREYPVILLCLGEGIQCHEWIKYISNNLSNWTIQCHGLRHIKHDKLSNTELFDSLSTAKKRLEDAFGVEITTFYPPYRRLKGITRSIVQQAGMEIDGKHVHIHKRASKWKITGRLDFHYWSRRDMKYMTRILSELRRAKNDN